MSDGATVHCIALLTQPGIKGSAHIRMPVRHRLLVLVLVARRSFDPKSLFCVFEIFWSPSTDVGNTPVVSQYLIQWLVKIFFFVVSVV
jgi:hypothetical protein